MESKNGLVIEQSNGIRKTDKGREARRVPHCS